MKIRQYATENMGRIVIRLDHPGGEKLVVPEARMPQANEQTDQADDDRQAKDEGEQASGVELHRFVTVMQ
jgi:hypothetical protein